MGISVRQKGNFNKTERFLKKAMSVDLASRLDKYGQSGVEALASYTPVDSGLTADSWTYDILTDSLGITINWYNSNVNDGFNVALGIQYGHGVNGGGYVAGIDYINPALRPIFDNMANAIWSEICSW